MYEQYLCILYLFIVEIGKYRSAHDVAYDQSCYSRRLFCTHVERLNMEPIIVFLAWLGIYCVYRTIKDFIAVFSQYHNEPRFFYIMDKVKVPKK